MRVSVLLRCPTTASVSQSATERRRSRAYLAHRFPRLGFVRRKHVHGDCLPYSSAAPRRADRAAGTDGGGPSMLMIPALIICTGLWLLFPKSFKFMVGTFVGFCAGGFVWSLTAMAHHSRAVQKWTALSLAITGRPRPPRPEKAWLFGVPTPQSDTE